MKIIKNHKKILQYFLFTHEYICIWKEKETFFLNSSILIIKMVNIATGGEYVILDDCSSKNWKKKTNNITKKFVLTQRDVFEILPKKANLHE